ncbi:16S rRNA (cytidine(1402)-2'-O)-methyltransferase [bacterium]|nr:16S rRNA (cytidine(1402)-2'-O)-methyltransferase [bacterium]
MEAALFNDEDPLATEKSLVSAATLYVVSTPIGNLADITYRAVAVLKHVDLIAAEDTRTSRVLLDHYGINTAMISYHDFNEDRAAPDLIRRLKQGLSIALITDAGTPGISDPAFYLIRAALQENLAVCAVPGPTALIPALLLSGLPCERFSFEGFLPVKKGRQKRLQQLQAEQRTMVFYEAPHRLQRTLADLYHACGDRPAAIARELTKKFEQVLRGTLSRLIEEAAGLPLKGEFVIIVEGLSRQVEKATRKTRDEHEY